MNIAPEIGVLTRSAAKLAFLVLLTGLACGGLAGNALGGEGDKMAETRVIDDFSRQDGASVLGTQWRTITDQVMGGVSTASHKFEELDSRRALRLRGKVSLENNGGFIQAQLPLDGKGGALNATGFKGIRLWVRGNGETYSLHIRTGSMFLPWQFFHAEFTARDKWEKVELAFDQFKAESMLPGAKLDPATLKTIGIVGIKRAFDADVGVSRIEVYR